MTTDIMVHNTILMFQSKENTALLADPLPYSSKIHPDPYSLMAKIKFGRENNLKLLSQNNISQAGTAIAIQRAHLKVEGINSARGNQLNSSNIVRRLTTVLDHVLFE